MKSPRQDLILGIVVLVFLALFVGTVLFVYPVLTGETRQITIRFRHDQGMAPLKAGSPVMLSGALQVGKVLDVRTRREPTEGLDRRKEDLLIIVDAEIEADLKLFEDCRVTTSQPPVGGGGILVIQDVGAPPAAEVTGVIDGLPPLGLSAAIDTLTERVLGPDGLLEKVDGMLDASAEGSLASKIGKSLDDVNAMTQALRGQLDPGEQEALISKVHSIVENVNDTTAALRAQLTAGDEDNASLMAKVHLVLGELETGLAEVNAMLKENRPALRQTVASVESVTRQMDGQLLATFKTELNRDDPSSLLGKLHASMDRVNTSLDNVVTMTDTGRKLLVMNRPLVEGTLENLKEASDQAKALVLEIVLHPWRLWRPPTAEIKKSDAFVAAQHFAEAATKLDDVATRLEAVLAASPPDGELLGSHDEIRAIQDSLRSAFERFQTAEDYLWEQMK
jgi:ABC-type transporter Mla subunit MlaD